VGVDDRGDDREAETGAGAPALAAALGAPEALEQRAGIVGGQAGTVVADLEPDVAAARDRDLDRRALRRVDERVAQQIAEYLAQLMGIALHLGRLGGLELDRAVGRGRAGVIDSVAGERRDVDVDVRDVGQLVEPGEHQQVLDEDTHARGLLLDAPHRLLRLRRAARGAHAEQLGVAADRGQRRAQLVRRVGDELAQAVLALLALGERTLEAVEHRVERDPEAPDLGAGVGGLDAVRQVAAGDRAGGVAHAVEREQADAHDRPRREAEREQHAADHEALDEQQAAQRGVHLAQRDGDDRDVLRGLPWSRADAARVDAVAVVGDESAKWQLRRQVRLRGHVLGAEHDLARDHLSGLGITELAVGAGGRTVLAAVAPARTAAAVVVVGVPEVPLPAG
jgi:hypothetical protein